MNPSPIGRLWAGQPRAALCLLFACLWAISWLALPGCASKDKGFDDEFTGQAGQLRRNKTRGQQLGLSARSRQIESDLGVE